jgi:uncharacterized membrane protein YqiK
MDVVATTKRSVAAVLGVVVLLIVILLAWIGGEQHYRACLEQAALEYPVATAQGAGEPAARSDAIDGCSRWP